MQGGVGKAGLKSNQMRSFYGDEVKRGRGGGKGESKKPVLLLSKTQAGRSQVLTWFVLVPSSLTGRKGKRLMAPFESFRFVFVCQVKKGKRGNLKVGGAGMCDPLIQCKKVGKKKGSAAAQRGRQPLSSLQKGGGWEGSGRRLVDILILALV